MAWWGADAETWWLARRAGRLARAEDGSLTVFGLFVLLIVFAAAGLAIDTMRAERERVRLQATLDRAVLAAADLEQSLTPEEVVESYFEAAGLLDALGEDAVTVDQGLNHRSVSAVASRDVPTAFLGLVGVDSLPAATVATAEERRSVEISLVLDVSGSMEDHGRIGNLRRAATQFVQAVMPEAAPSVTRGTTTVSLVPYSTSVNAGRDLLNLYALDRVHEHSNCVLFADGNYDDVALPPTRPLTQYEHFDPGVGGYISTNPYRIAQPLCPRKAEGTTPERNLMRPLATDAAALIRDIAALQAEGSTEMDAGMRWGIAMLDPQTQPVVDALVARGDVDPSASGRPLDYGTENAIKVAVLMTDGEPQAPFDIDPKLKGGKSNVWYDAATGRYSVLLRGNYLERFPYTDADALTDGCANAWKPGARNGITRDGIKRVAAGNQNDEDCEPRWYWASSAEIHDHPDWSGADRADADSRRLGWRTSGTLRRLANREVFDHATAADAHRYFYLGPRQAGWLSNPEWAVLRGTEGGSWKRIGVQSGVVSRLLRICTAAKDRGVLIFTIGFEIDRIELKAGQDLARELMSGCATSPDHYYDVKSVSIAEAFSTIAGQIEQLRLTR